jgi:6-phosphogluconolactonase
MMEICETPEAMARRAAEVVERAAREAVDARGRFMLAISGGSTPLMLFQILGDDEWRARVPWARTEVFWADERCVPPTHTDSNYHHAERLLLGRVSPGAVHRIKGELPPAEAALEYERVLAERFGGQGAPVFDLVLLGMGEDGHTASLFAGSAALAERARYAVDVTERAVARVSLTLPALNAARSVVFMASGDSKAVPLADILLRGNPGALPAGMVRQAGGGEPLWIVDHRAARLLKV